MTLFESIFGASWETYHRGQLVLAGPVSPQILVVALPLLIALAWYAYRMVAQRATVKAWRTLLALRLALLFLMLVLLAGPALRVMHSRNDLYIARAFGHFALDGDCRYRFRRRWRESTPRDGCYLGAALIRAGSSALGSAGRVLLYGFDEKTRRISDASQIKAEGEATDIYRGVHDMDAELRGMPLASVVVLSDGGSNTGGTTQDAATILAARGVPLYTVGLGDPNPPKDYEVVGVAAPRRVQRNSEVRVQVTVRHTGYPDPFDLAISRGSNVLATQHVVPNPGERPRHRVDGIHPGPGGKRYLSCGRAARAKMSRM